MSLIDRLNIILDMDDAVDGYKQKIGIDSPSLHDHNKWEAEVTRILNYAAY